MKDDQFPKSVADDIMRKKKAKKMAEGGMVDLDENAMESSNTEDDLSFEALKKENYSEADAIDHDQPMDSNEHGDELNEGENQSMIDALRRKIKAKRGM